MAITPTGDRNRWSALTRALRATWFGEDVGGSEAPPLALNNEYLNAPNAAGTAYVGIAKINASDVPQIGNSAVIGTPGSGATAIVTVGGTQTLTSKTLTSPTITGATITTPTITGATVSGAISADTVRSSAQFDAVTGTTGVTLTNVTGLVVTVVPGTYRFYLNLPGISTANCGIKTGFKLTTAVLTSIEVIGRLFTAAAVAVQHTTTATDQMTLAAQTAAVIDVVIEGTVVVATGGTIQLQAAQNAAHADTTSVYVGASMTFTRIA